MTEPAGPRSRRRVVVLAAIALSVLLVGGVVAAVQLQPVRFALVPRSEIGPDGGVVDARGEPPAAVDPAGDGTAVCALVSIAVAGPLTGDRAASGTGVRDGVRMAVDAHNSANAGCQVQLKELDTDAAAGSRAAAGRQLVEDVYTIGMIGPAELDPELRDALVRSGLVTAAVTANAEALPTGGRSAFFRGSVAPAAQGAAVAGHLTRVAGHRRICVFDDGTPYGTALARAAASTLGAGGTACATASSSDPEQLAATIHAADPDAVFFGGSPERAGELLRQLRGRGSGAQFVSVTDANGSALFGFLDGDAARVAVALPFGPRPAWFADAFDAEFDRQPGGLPAVGYDLATIMLRGIDAGMLTRPQLAEWMRSYDGQGVAHRYRWGADGELVDPTVWLYDVERR